MGGAETAVAGMRLVGVGLGRGDYFNPSSLQRFDHRHLNHIVERPMIRFTEPCESSNDIGVETKGEVLSLCHTSTIHAFPPNLQVMYFAIDSAVKYKYTTIIKQGGRQ